MPIYGVRALKLAFLFSMVVSCIQIVLYRTIVLNTKRTLESRYPWRPGIFDKETHESKREEDVTSKPNTSPSTVQIIVTTTKQVDDEVLYGIQPKTCSLHTQVPDTYQLAKIKTDRTDWSFRKRVICPYMDVNTKRKLRWKFILSCNKVEAYMGFVKSNSTDDIQRFYPDDKCLNLFINQCCSDAFAVPNVVHYVWYEKQEMHFIEFVSFMSALRFIRPCAIFIHGNSLPQGKYWDFIVHMFPKIIHIYRKVPKELFGQEIKYKEHVADAWRIKALLKYGGIYMDSDMLLVKPIGPLRQYPYTMSRQTLNTTVSPAFIMSERNATFAHDWLKWYKMYYVNDSYSYNVMMYPQFLAGRKPNDVHIEFGTASRPVGQVGDIIFRKNSDWSDIYGMHIFAKLYKRSIDFVDINNVRTYNTTVGAMCRHILFGNKDLCK